jgi:hypothetical protein
MVEINRIKQLFIQGINDHALYVQRTVGRKHIGFPYYLLVVAGKYNKGTCQNQHVEPAEWCI